MEKRPKAPLSVPAFPAAKYEELGLRRFALDERREAGGQPSTLARSIANVGGVLAHWMIVGQADKNRFAIAKNQGEKIIEIVRDSYDIFRFDAAR
ncbi:MAG: hypothetical protein WBD87_04435 [Candidatus Acidiferrales bacterium]